MTAAETFIFVLSGKQPVVGLEFTHEHWDKALDVTETMGLKATGEERSIKRADCPFGLDSDRRVFFDDSFFVARKIGKLGGSGLTARNLWRLEAITQLPAVPAKSAEPVCRCSARDLTSGPHPKECEWLKWRKAARS